MSELRIGLFYGSSTCFTEIAAERIRDTIGADLVTLHNIQDTSLTETAHYDYLIFGISTWDFGELQEDWESIWADAENLQLDGKVVALFGLGDQVGYTDWFQDALGMLHDAISQSGAIRIGFWPNVDYTFNASKALTEDGEWFVGLALDEDSQYEYSEERIQQWCEQILTEMAQV